MADSFDSPSLMQSDLKNVQVTNQKKPHKWFWLAGLTILIISIVLVGVIFDSNYSDIRKGFLDLIERASNSSTNVGDLSDEVISRVIIPPMCEIPENCVALKGKELVKCAQEESLKSSEFEQCVVKQAAEQNNSDLCYALATFAQSTCLAQTYYLNGNIEGCRSLNYLRDYCILQISNRIGKTTYCNEIENENQMEQCFKLEWPKKFEILSPLPNSTWTNGSSYVIRWALLSDSPISTPISKDIEVRMLIIPEGDFVVSLNKTFKVKNDVQESQYNFSFTSEDKLLNLTFGKYRLVLEFFGLDAQKTFLGRGEVNSITLDTGILPINKSLNTKINPDAPKPVPSADIYVISETPIEIEISFALSPDDLSGEQDVSYYDIWRVDSVSKLPIKLGDVQHSQSIYVDSAVNNPDNSPKKNANYYYFIRTYDIDGNHADSTNFWLST